MATNTISGDLIVTGELAAATVALPAACITDTNVSNAAAIARAKLAQDVLKPYPVNLTDLRVWDAMATVLPGTAANDDLGLIGGTFATGSPSIQAGDLKSAGATTRYARFLVALPAEYDSGETVTVRIHAGMVTTVADTSCTVDVQAYESNGEAGISADLCATAAQSMNSLTYADKDFTITPTALVAGDVLDVRVAVTCTDASGGAAVIPVLGSITLLCDVRG